jgi:hypothetical protein
MANPGYWISPDGEVLEVTRHIDYVKQNPEKFELSQDDIRDFYKKYNERPGIEGKAREDILIHAIEAGWVRARYFGDGWHIQIKGLDPTTKSNLAKWAEDVRGERRPDYARATTPVFIDRSYGISVPNEYSLGNISEGMFRQARRSSRRLPFGY